MFSFLFLIQPELVTFRLHGWCMLGIFLLPLFTHPGHECQDLLSLCDGMHVCTDETSVYTLIQKSSREWSQNPCELQGKSPLNRRVRRGSNPQCHIMQSSEPNTLQTVLFWPLNTFIQIHTHTLIHTHTHTHLYTQENTHKHTHTQNKNTHTQTHARTHTRTHTL